VDTASLLDRPFFERATDVVACELVGCTLATNKSGRITSGRIVETEAYGGASDLASHAAIYQRARSGIMSGPAGISYVYRSYGVHACFNVVARLPGSTGAVLIRALEPLEGIELMIQRRGLVQPKLLCSGPGRLAQALGITLDDNGVDVVAGNTIAIRSSERPSHVLATIRIGITRDTDRLWRFCEAGSLWLSRAVSAAPGASMTS
jgi:DNA-3-methyladenine glycosylase